MELESTLAEFIIDLEFENIPQSVIDKGKLCVLDCLASALSGYDDPATQIIGNYVEEFGGKPQASILGTQLMTDVMHAALANGIIAHATDFDDYHEETVIHATGSCLPALLALAEYIGASGKDILKALVIGVDVCIRMGLSLGSYHYELGWHSTATAGRFGATAAACKLLKLSKEQSINALGICGTQAAGLRQVFGTMTKPFNAGKAAMDGVMAAVLASRGWDCSQDIIEGELGIFDVMTAKPNREIIMEGLGKKFHILDMSFKPYPSCACTHSVIGLLEEIQRKHRVNIDQVKEIRVKTGPVAFTSAGNKTPRKGVEGKFSLWFLAALALAEGSVTIDKFTDQKVNDPELVALRKKVNAELVRELKLGGQVKVILKDGVEYTGSTKHPKGGPDNPMDFQELSQKFYDAAKLELPEKNIDPLLDIIHNLEKVRDIKEIFTLARKA
jgi:2-methylcitrate dehydratase PrpD